MALKNSLIDAFRSQQVFKKFIAEYDKEETVEASQEEQIIAQDNENAIINLTEMYKSALSKRQQEIIHYRFVEELKIEEIAKLLNINYQSVANTIQRSLKKIREILYRCRYKNSCRA